MYLDSGLYVGGDVNISASMYIGVAYGIVDLYVIVNLGIEFASAMESASPPSRRTFVVNFMSETKMLLGRGYAPGAQAYLFFRVCTC